MSGLATKIAAVEAVWYRRLGCVFFHGTLSCGEWVGRTRCGHQRHLFVDFGTVPRQVEPNLVLGRELYLDESWCKAGVLQLYVDACDWECVPWLK